MFPNCGDLLSSGIFAQIYSEDLQKPSGPCSPGLLSLFGSGLNQNKTRTLDLEMTSA